MATRKRFVGILTASVSAGLLIAGFLVPPTGVIDPSVFTGVGLLLAFKVVDELPDIIRKNGGATVSVGGTTVSITSDKEKEEKNGDSV
ncbi:MAG: hypothetical protein K6A67_01470 [Bacteroidales bacterium]|nr:hypothetical protein [Bacteroidales bacterium]